MTNRPSIAAVIAEYNPFHNGHAYQLKAARELTGADKVIVIMNGDFVQRGEPAIADKYDRAISACANGADAVFLMPFCAGISSIADFATGGVMTANAMGCIDYLVFGTESKTITELTEAADNLIRLEGDQEMQNEMASVISSGMTYPEALSKVLINHGMEQSARCTASPNNSLGINYIMALKKTISSIKPSAVARVGTGHHGGFDKHSATASASAIRINLRNKDTSLISPFIPVEMYQALCRYGSSFISANDFSDSLFYKLGGILESSGNKTAFAKKLSTYSDMSEDLSLRIYNKINDCYTWDELAAAIWSKNLTYSRIDRALLHIIFNIDDRYMQIIRKAGSVGYLRPLVIKRDALDLLGYIKKSGTAPLITRLSDVNALTGATATDFQKSLSASRYYRRIYKVHHSHACHDEYGKDFMMIV